MTSHQEELGEYTNSLYIASTARSTDSNYMQPVTHNLEYMGDTNLGSQIPASTRIANYMQPVTLNPQYKGAVGPHTTNPQSVKTINYEQPVT